MALLQVFKSFKFNFLFTISLALEDEWSPLMSFTQLGHVSSVERSPSIIISYSACENLCN
jgi:hypothetical protein